MKLFELTIEDENVDEIFAISMVSNPAIELFGTYFHKEEVLFREMNEEGLFMAPILVPDKKILRVDGEGKPYAVFFSKNTIKRLAQMYLEKKYQHNVTEEHDSKVKGIVMVESWIKEGKLDKSGLYGLNVPIGTWMGTFKIGNEEMRDKFRKGELRAVSIEGLFEHKLVEASYVESLLDKDIDSLTEDESEVLFSYITATIKKRVEMESYSDYPQSATNNAKRALEYVEKNGWGDCGEATGKARASQLANREPISRDTIARMASFKRHQQHKDVPYTEGCGGLMWDCWGGTSGIEWAINKLKEIDSEKLAEGVPHYTADGKLYEGPTHKDGSGKLMTGEVHTEDSKFLYHKEAFNFAEVGPRGGIKEAPKAPKSDTPNKNPKGEGSAEGKASGKRGAKVTQEQEKTLQGKVDDFNKKDSNTKNGRATLGALKSVFQRGLGAFNTSHSPRVQSASQWAFARVNAFLYLLKNGRPENPKYNTDFDLLPKGHPKASDKLEAQVSVSSTYPGEVASGSISPSTL